MASQSNLREFDADDILCDPKSSIVGSGSFGVVLVGKHKSLNKLAVKVMECHGGEQTKERFKQCAMEELGKLQTAQTEHVVRTYGWLTLSCGMGIVMQYYEGGNLRDFLLNNRITKGIPLRLRQLVETADGIAFIHNLPGHKLVHNDVKPENILLTRDLHAKLTDFGSAKLAAATGSTTVRLPATGEKIQFTALYTAPEKLKNVTMRPKKEHDVYGYGLVIHMSLTCEEPYPPTEINTLTNAIINGERPDCDAIDDLKANLENNDKGAVEVMEEEMKRCWEHDPTKRPDITKVRDKFQSLVDAQNPAAILEQVTNSVRQMDLKVERPAENQLVPIRQFSPRDKTFLTTQESSRTAVNIDLPSTSRDTPTGQSSRPQLMEAEHDVTSPQQQGDVTSTDLDEIFQPKFRSNEKSKLVQKYSDSAKRGKYNEAHLIKQQLSRLIESQVKTTANELKTYAVKLRNAKKYHESILFCHIASDFYAKQQSPDDAARGLMVCAWQLQKTNKSMMDSDFTNKTIVVDHVIPLIADMRHQIQTLPQVDDKIRCVCEATCLSHIGFSLHLIGSYQREEETFREAINLFKRKFGDDAAKYEVYGGLLNNLGFVCWKTSRDEEAVKYYTEAIEACRKSKVLTEEERKRFIDTIQNNLWFAKEILKQ